MNLLLFNKRPIHPEEEYMIKRRELETEFKLRQRLLKDEMIRKISDLAKRRNIREYPKRKKVQNSCAKDYIQQNSSQLLLDNVARIKRVKKKLKNIQKGSEFHKAGQNKAVIQNSTEISKTKQKPLKAFAPRKSKIIHKRKAKNEECKNLSKNNAETTQKLEKKTNSKFVNLNANKKRNRISILRKKKEQIGTTEV